MFGMTAYIEVDFKPAQADQIQRVDILAKDENMAKFE